MNNHRHADISCFICHRLYVRRRLWLSQRTSPTSSVSCQARPSGSKPTVHSSSTTRDVAGRRSWGLTSVSGTNVHGTTSGDGVKSLSYRWYPRKVLPFPAATFSTVRGSSPFMSCLFVTGRRYTPHICRNAIPHGFAMVSRQ